MITMQPKRLMIVNKVDKDTGHRVIEKWDLLKHTNIANVR
jgi:hypothetical protein